MVNLLWEVVSLYGYNIAYRPGTCKLQVRKPGVNPAIRRSQTSLFGSFFLSAIISDSVCASERSVEKTLLFLRDKQSRKAREAATVPAREDAQRDIRRAARVRDAKPLELHFA